MTFHLPLSIVSTALALALPLGITQGETSTTGEVIPNTAAAKPLVLPAGEHGLVKVTDLVGGYLGLNILSEDLAAAPQRGNITFKQDLSLEGQQALDVLSQLLDSSGFMLTALNRSANLFEVVDMQRRPSSLTSRAEFRSPDEVLARPNLAMPVLVTVRLKHIHAQSATNSLRPFFAGHSGKMNVVFGNVGDRHSLLLSGSQATVADALRMLALVDQPMSEVEESELDALRKRIAALEKALAELKPNKD